MPEEQKEYMVYSQMLKKEEEIDKFIKKNFTIYGFMGAVIFVVFYVTVALVYKMVTKKREKPEELRKLLQDKKELRKNWRVLRDRKLENREIEGYLKGN